MRAVMVMFDSLNRRMLQPYGSDWTITPNFSRLAARTLTFDTSYVGSMPCMPARREIHTGRYNFLHRSWSPLEPFDESMPELLGKHGIATHLVTDHHHYWEDGGATYHTRYGACEFSRGKEADGWKTDLRKSVPVPEALPGRITGGARRRDWVNRRYMRREEDFPQAVTFALGEEFIRVNHGEDDWFLQIETFDPHEPFFAPDKYRALYAHDYAGPHFDWPPYSRVTQTPEEVRHMRLECAALHSMCDASLGRILDLFDEYDLWKDTMLIVNTDHGFLLGEHGWWAKVIQPFYDEIARTPLFLWDPRRPICGERRSALVQTIDLAPTLLEYFGIERPSTMEGIPLGPVVECDRPIREGGLFGRHGAHVNVTDGRYVYMRGPATSENQPLFEYTLMPTHMDYRFRVEELQNTELAEPFPFTRGCRTLKIPVKQWWEQQPFETLLFDLAEDPGQNRPIRDAVVEERMTDLMVRLMLANEAPPEQYERLGLEEHVRERR